VLPDGLVWWRCILGIYLLSLPRDIDVKVLNFAEFSISNRLNICRRYLIGTLLGKREGSIPSVSIMNPFNSMTQEDLKKALDRADETSKKIDKAWNDYYEKPWKDDEQYYTIESDTLEILQKIKEQTDKSIEEITDMLLKDAAENLWRRL
jgi:predicted small secreted protein